MSVAGLYLLLNASFVAAAQVLVYVGAVNVLIIFAIMLVNKKEDLKPINDIKSRRVISTSICLTLLSLLIRVDLTMYGAYQVLKTLLEKNQLSGLVNIYLVIIYSHLK